MLGAPKRFRRATDRDVSQSVAFYPKHMLRAGASLGRPARRAPRGVGATDTFWGCAAYTDEVLVFRTRLSGVHFTKPDQALLFVRAVGRHNDYQGHVRGAVIEPLGGAEYLLDVIMTPRIPIPYNADCSHMALYFGGPQTAEDLAQAVVSDPDIGQSFPHLQLHGFELLELVGPAGAVDHWLAHNILWDKGLDKPTDAFGKREGVYSGRSDQAPNIKPWLPEQPLFGDIPPKDDKTLAAGVQTSWLWIGGAAVTALAVAHLVMTRGEAA